MPLRVLIAEDHNMVRQALRRILAEEPDFELVGEANDGLQVENKVARHRPDVVILDVMMPGLSGLEVLQRLRLRFRRIQVLMLSNYTDKAYVLKALDLGASGYVAKSDEVRELIQAVREVAAGREYLSKPFEDLKLELERLKAEGRSIDLYQSLTRKEKEVLQLLAEGLTNKEVAARLGNKERTVESHRASIMRKLGCPNLAALVRFAVDWGLLEKRQPPPGTSGEEPQSGESPEDHSPPAPV